MATQISFNYFLWIPIMRLVHYETINFFLNETKQFKNNQV